MPVMLSFRPLLLKAEYLLVFCIHLVWVIYKIWKKSMKPQQCKNKCPKRDILYSVSRWKEKRSGHPYFLLLHNSSSCVEIGLQTENQHPGLPGSALNISVVVLWVGGPTNYLTTTNSSWVSWIKHGYYLIYIYCHNQPTTQPTT